VETAEQAATLHRLGYRFAQGYHFSRPLTAAQLLKRLEAGAQAAQHWSDMQAVPAADGPSAA
jgi:EAL domain-containing protein (putative c-di-GMP-specific phosphodiesterase class I)